MRRLLAEHLRELGSARHRVFYPEHHLSHAASAFYPSPFDEAAILTIDGVGEWATTTIGRGRGQGHRDPERAAVPALGRPALLGVHLLPRVHGQQRRVQADGAGAVRQRRLSAARKDFVGRDHVASWWTFGRTARCCSTCRTSTSPPACAWCTRHGGSGCSACRVVTPESELTQAHMDLALAIQQVTEEIVLRLARTARDAHRQPASDDGGRRRAQLRRQRQDPRERHVRRHLDSARGRRCGRRGRRGVCRLAHPSVSRAAAPSGGAGRAIRLCDAMSGSLSRTGVLVDADRRRPSIALRRTRTPLRRRSRALAADVAARLAAGEVGGWFQGRMEFGPRALGNRSIIGDPRNPEMQKRLNLKIKFREGFRPFAPSVLEEDVAEHFELDRPSPYMLLVTPVRKDRQRPLPPDYADRAALRPAVLPSARTCRRSRTWTTRRASRP